MPVRYSNTQRRTGAAIGTIICAPRPSSWTSGTDNWNLTANFPGYLECDGSALNPNQYYALYQVIGTTYGGSVSGSYPSYTGTFNLPNFRGKFVMGTGTVDGNSGAAPGVTPSLTPSGNTGGSYNDCGATGGSFTLNTVRQLPSGSEITPGNPGSPISTGGTATDTYEIGTFRTSGFSTAIAQPNASITGNISWTTGPLKTQKVYGATPHGHQLSSSRVLSSTTSSTADGGPGGPDKMPFYQSATGGIVSYTRFIPTWDSGGSGATATATVSGGVITSVTVTNGGSGYVTAPGITVTSSTTPTSEAAFTVSINGSGQVTGVVVNFGGVGYSSTVTLTFTASSATAPLRAHTHKLHELGPGTATWGHDEGSGNTGSQSTAYTGVQAGATDIADTINKTLAIGAGGLEVDLNQGDLTMSDSSRTLFDSRLVVRLTSAETLPIMQPYFRTKYLIKAI
jgi:microcystin-dependent protein